MIIEILNQKYRCGCEKGINKLEIPGLISKLNTVIDWEKTKFPLCIDKSLGEEKIKELQESLRELKEKYNSIDESNESERKAVENEFGNIANTLYKEDRLFLGDNPELKPGNVFEILPGQIVAVDDKNTLILIVSETGACALDRIWKEHIEPEFNMYFGNSDVNKVTWKELTSDPSPEFDKEYRPEYEIYKSWKNSFLEKNSNIPSKGFKIEVTMDSENYILPVNFIMKDWSILYKSEELEEDMIENAVKELLSWFYNEK